MIRGYAREGLSHIQIWLSPSTIEGLEWFASVLDLLDRLLDKGVMANGDVTLGVAGVDLIYLRLATILCAADRIFPRDPLASKRKSRHRQPGGRRSR